MSINIDNNVKNQGKAPAMLTGLDADKPNPGQPGRLYYATDTNIIYIDNGSAWVVFLQSAGGTISVTPNYIAKADASGNLIASAFYQDPTTGNVALNNNVTTKGKLTITDNANRVIFGIVNVSTSGDDKTGEVRFYGYDGSTVTTLGQIYQTNNDQVNTNAFKNSINIKANRTDGTITFIVGGDTSANIKGFINNDGNWIIGNLIDNGLGKKLQVNGGVQGSDFYIYVSDEVITTLASNQLNMIDDTVAKNGFYKNTGVTLSDGNSEEALNLSSYQLNIVRDSDGASSTHNVNALGFDDPNNEKAAYYTSTSLSLIDNSLGGSLVANTNQIVINDPDNGLNATYGRFGVISLDTNDTNQFFGNYGRIARYNFGSLVFNQASTYTQIKELDLGTLSNVPSVSIGFTGQSGYKNNRGTITYTGGALAGNTTVTCTITFMGSYPLIPYGYVSDSTNIAGNNIQLVVTSITASAMNISIHNLSGGSIPSGTIKFNYLVIV